MQQRDNCGCGKVITPTLEELLAVARKKPLPTMRVRDRQPPPAKVGASLKGWMRWGLIDRRGREVKGGEGPNLITDQGLDQIATKSILLRQGAAALPTPGTYFEIIAYCAVGTDNTAPAVTDTALGTEVGRTATMYQEEELNRTSNGVYELTRYIEFDYAEANGNLTEWGFSYDGTGPGLLFNRALFLDGGGSPEVVTKTSDYKLRIIYTLEVTLSPVTMTSGAFTLTGVGTVNGDYTLVGGASPPGAVGSGDVRCLAPDLQLFTHWARGGPAYALTDSSVYRYVRGMLRALDSDQASVVYADQLGELGAGKTLMPNAEGAARDAYVSGSFQRTGGAWKFDTDVGNLAPIKAFSVTAGDSWSSGLQDCAAVGYMFDLDLADEFSKDSEHTLTIGVPTVSWARGS